MRKSRTILLACAAIACAALTTGCTKGRVFSHGGEAIRFTTASGGGYTTKTVYGDDVETDGVKKQALNWVDGDVITIASPQAEVQNVGGHASNYVIVSPTAGVPSKGSVQNEGDNGLMWGDDADATYDFYAVYPKMRDGLTLDPATGLVTAGIPAEQALTGTATTKTVGEGDDAITYKVYAPDMDYAYMTAATKGVTPSEDANAVSLTFNPAFTAFEFNVSSQDDEIELTQFQILSPEGSSDNLAGTFTMTAGSLTTASATSGTASVTVPMTETVTAAEGLTFTVFTLPLVNEDALRVRFTSKDGDEDTKTSWIDLKYSNSEAAGDNAGKALQFQAGHKYRINMLKLPSNQWKITIAAEFEEWVEAEDEVVIYI